MRKDRAPPRGAGASHGKILGNEFSRTENMHTPTNSHTYVHTQHERRAHAGEEAAAGTSTRLNTAGGIHPPPPSKFIATVQLPGTNLCRIARLSSRLCSRALASMSEEGVMEIAEMTGLDVQEARVLLEAAGGNIGLAVELHFEAGISPAAAESSGVSEEPLVTTQQRFSVLAVDAEDADDANDSDDELIFPLLAGAGDRRHGGAAAAQQQQQQQQQRHGGGRKKSRGKARGAGGSSGDAGLDIGGDYDILSLHAAADEEMASAMDEDAFPMSRRRSKGARSVPLMVPTRGGRRSGARGDDDDDDDPRPAHSPSDTASGSASGSTSHRRRAKRASQRGKASRDGGGERRSGALSASPNEGRLTPPSYAGSPSPNTPEGSYSASNLCLASVPTVRGFATPPMSSSAPNAAPPSSPPPAVDGTSGSVGASGSGGGSSGFGRNRKPASIAARAERAMSQVMWDPRFEAVRSGGRRRLAIGAA